MAVMAIAKTPVRTMMITIQKFKLCMDVLTLNRMTHFRHQISPAEQALLKVPPADSCSTWTRLRRHAGPMPRGDDKGVPNSCRSTSRTRIPGMRTRIQSATRLSSGLLGRCRAIPASTFVVPTLSLILLGSSRAHCVC